MGQPALLEAARLQLTELVMVPLTVAPCGCLQPSYSQIAERGSVNGAAVGAANGSVNGAAVGAANDSVNEAADGAANESVNGAADGAADGDDNGAADDGADGGDGDGAADGAVMMPRGRWCCWGRRGRRDGRTASAADTAT